MHFPLSMLGEKLLPVLPLILSLSYSDRSVKASERNELNLCTQRHCENCAGGESLKCSNVASSNRCGDLCGCCHSCVQFRGYEESCGSQLAVRSSENFQYLTSPVTILATTSCRKDLICKNFACERLKKVNNFESNDEESLESRTNLITIENLNELKRNIDKIGNDKAVFERGMKFSTFTRIPSTSQSQKNKIYCHNSQQNVKKMKNILLNPSGHLMNLLVGEKEFQLIYGDEPLRDFNLLIDSIDKNHSNSIINEFEAKILGERFNEIVQFVNSKRKISNDEKLIDSSSMSRKIEKQVKNGDRTNIATNRESAMITAFRNFSLIPGTGKISRLQGPARKFRRKRQLERSKDEVKVDDSTNEREIDEKMSKEYSQVSVYNVVTKTPRPIEDFHRWMIARKIEINPDEKSSVGQIVDGDGIESEINIHITGVPKITNFSPEGTDEKKQDSVRIDEELAGEYENYDDSDKFITDANTEIPDFSTMKEPKKLANVTSEISQSQIIIDDTTENYWTNDEKSQFFNNYEFAYPETSEGDSFRYFDTFVNETVDELKSQLDRIETRTMLIESVLFDMMEKSEEEWKNIENRQTNVQSFHIDPDNTNEFEKKIVTRDSMIDDIPREKSISPRSSTDYPESQDFISNQTKLGHDFFQNRSNRHTTTFTIEPNFPETEENSPSQRRRPNKSRENKSDQSEVSSGRGELTGQTNEESQSRRSSLITFSKNPPSVPGRRKFPILLSKGDSKKGHFYKYQQDYPRLFSRQLSNLEVTSDSQQHRPVWPLNLILNRGALSADRNSRKSQRSIGQGGKNLEVESPIDESVILLETQIPKSISQSRDSMIFRDRIGESSMRFVTRYGDDENWNWADEKPSLNLFVVDGGNSEFGITSSRLKLPKTLVLPMENIRMEKNNEESEAMDENYQIFPAYFDYYERLENKKNDDKIVESEMTESTISPMRSEEINSKSNGRKERSLNDFSETQDFNDNNTIFQFRKTINSNFNDSSFNSSKNADADDDDKNMKKSLNAVADLKNRSGKRSKRSVEMADWLRAAHEYDERLRQVRNAAMKTWLASIEQFDENENLTSVKLFTREIPAYLERYRSNFQDAYFNVQDEESEEALSGEIPYPELSRPDTGQLSTDISPGETQTDQSYSELEINASNDARQLTLSEISNLNGPKRLTIMTSGNSTIRIEEISDNEEEVASLDDQSAQGSIGISGIYEIPITLSETDYFDHMYESVDANDDEFDYEDPNLTMSRWLEQVDVIESSSVEMAQMKNHENEQTEEHQDPSIRFKRHSPFFLFKVKGNPQHDVVVWPSNWKDLINRHFRLNPTGDSSEKTTERTSDSRLGKIIHPKLGSSSATIPSRNLHENQTNQHDGVPSLSEKSIRHSTIDLDVVRKLQNNFDHRTRQNRRKNGVYRSNVGNY